MVVVEPIKGFETAKDLKAVVVHGVDYTVTER